jgi:hypothetical protein
MICHPLCGRKDVIDNWHHRQYNIYNTPALVYFRKMVPVV